MSNLIINVNKCGHMRQVTEKEIENGLILDNPWWRVGREYRQPYNWRRGFFGPLYRLIQLADVHRAIVLMGPRRVGKTVLIGQAIEKLIEDGVGPSQILFASLENPLYLGLRLNSLLQTYLGRLDSDLREAATRPPAKGGDYSIYVFFDEIQYLTDWEVHLKSLVDSYPGVKFVASGSAAAALKLKSQESGAGRFTDFLLPPITFPEFLIHSEISEFGAAIDSIKMGDDARMTLEVSPELIGKLNTELIKYMNYGGFPEAIFAETIRDDPRQFIGRDIVDKVLLRDLPSLYGIRDTRELNRFFAMLAYNSGDEVSVSGLSKSSGIARNTIYKFIEYLEAAFLIHRVERIDQNARHFKNAWTFKIYLTNASLRAALFGPLSEDDPALGHMIETVVISQPVQFWRTEKPYYARWKTGEVDHVELDPATQKPVSAMEIKWSDRSKGKNSEIKNLRKFCIRHDLSEATILTKTYAADKDFDGVRVSFQPVSLYCAINGLLDMGLFQYSSRDDQLLLSDQP